MATAKPTAQTPHLQPSPRRNGAAAAYALWWISECIDFTSECWVWTGHRTETGYGILDLKNCELPQSTAQVHRIIYSLCIEPIPEGLCVLHRCDNPPCVRPAHLFLGTNLDNIADKIGKGRQAKGRAVRRNHEHLKGEAVITAELTAEGVLDIRRRFLACERPRDIAASVGMSDTHVYYIVQGKAWAHLPLIYGGSLKERPCPKCGKVFTTRQGALYSHVAKCGADVLKKE